MKKNLIILIVILFSQFKSLAQDGIKQLPIDSLTKRISYKSIVEVSGVSSNDIYKRSREWFATYFKSANSVLQMDDKESGKLIGKSAMKFSNIINAGWGVQSNDEKTIEFSINISIKDGKYRIIITDFTEVSKGASRALEANYVSESFLKSSNDKIMKQLYANVIKLFNDVDFNIKNAMESLKASVITTKKDDF